MSEKQHPSQGTIQTAQAGSPSNNNTVDPQERRKGSITESGIYVEESENHRYIRSHDIIRISFNGLLTSYKAFDTADGVEIVWHKISIPESNEEVKEKFGLFMNDLNELGKESFVENLAYWFSIESNQTTHYLNIITTNYETIREFISKVKTLRWKIIKKWCRQLVQALLRLHQFQPQSPIIHRYISCSHIYIDGGLGTIAVGDIWLSFQSDAFNLANSVQDVTRPNFDDPKGDIYALGLCILEMVSKDTSSKKRSSQPIIYSSEYIASVLPRVSNDAAKDLIQSCLLPTEVRPSIQELQNHAFLQPSTMDDEEVKLAPAPKSLSEASLASLDFPTRERMDSIDDSSLSGSGKMQSSSSFNPSPIALSSSTSTATTVHHAVTAATISESQSTPLILTKRHEGIGFRDEPLPLPLSFSVPVVPGIRVLSISKVQQSQRQQQLSQEYQLLITIPSNLFQDQSNATDKEVEFSVDFTQDDASSVAQEMIEELQLIISREELAAVITRTVQEYDTQTKEKEEKAVANEEEGKRRLELLAPAVSPEKKKEEEEEGRRRSANDVLSTPLSSTAPRERGENTGPHQSSPSTSPAMKTLEPLPLTGLLPESSAMMNTANTIASPLSSSSAAAYFTKSLSEEEEAAAGEVPSLNVCLESNSLVNASEGFALSPLEGLTMMTDNSNNSNNNNHSNSSNSNIGMSQSVGSMLPSTPLAPPTSNNLSSSDPPFLHKTEEEKETGPDLSTVLRSSEESLSSMMVRGRTSSNASLESGANKLEDNATTSVSTNANTPILRANLSAVDLTADLLLQKVLEKIDQETRAARRAFESRIQKLVKIQEECEEDLGKLKHDLLQKMMDYEKREETTKNKRDGELLKLKGDFEKNVQEFRLKLKASSLPTSSTATGNY